MKNLNSTVIPASSTVIPECCNLPPNVFVGGRESRHASAGPGLNTDVKCSWGGIGPISPQHYWFSNTVPLCRWRARIFPVSCSSMVITNAEGLRPPAARVSLRGTPTSCCRKTAVGGRSNLFKKISLFLLTLCFTGPLWAQDKNDINQAGIDSRAIFDDKALLEGYTQKYEDESKDTLLAMIADNSVGEYKCTAAVRVFKEKYANEVLSRQKPIILRILIRRFNRSDSPFVQVEIMHTLVVLDRYQYFESMVPALIQKMDHYNPVVRNMAYKDLLGITKDSLYPREARIVFETLRKIFFLSHNRLQNITTPDEKLRQKLDLLRWAIRILGTQELKRLPSEVINLL